MLTSLEVLTLYTAMSKLTAQMVLAAEAGDWERLSVLEARCAAHTRSLKEGEPPQPLQGEQRERKIALIRQMLVDDRRIRDLTMPWMAQLSALIGHTQTERRLVSAYGAV